MNIWKKVVMTLIDLISKKAGWGSPLLGHPLNGFEATQMEICHGLSRRPIPLRATRKYCPEEILSICQGCSPPYYIRVEDTLVVLPSSERLQLACEISSAYHNWVAYNAPEDDGFIEVMEAREAAVRS